MKSVLASSEFLCDYATDNSKKSTKISFTLPDKVAFGVLIPVEICQDSGSSAKMNTVILKDYTDHIVGGDDSAAGLSKELVKN